MNDTVSGLITLLSSCTFIESSSIDFHDLLTISQVCRELKKYTASIKWLNLLSITPTDYKIYREITKNSTTLFNYDPEYEQIYANFILQSYACRIIPQLGHLSDRFFAIFETPNNVLRRNINAGWGSACTILCYIICHNAGVDAVRAVLQYGFDLNGTICKSHQYNGLCNLIRQSVMRENYEVANLLLEKGYVSAQNSRISDLYIAIMKENIWGVRKCLRNFISREYVKDLLKHFSKEKIRDDIHKELCGYATGLMPNGNYCACRTNQHSKP